MTGTATRLVYVESAGDQESEESFAWYDGKALTAVQHAEREQLHRELGDIVESAESDETTPWGRAVRRGDHLLVEIEVNPITGVTRHLTATIVVSVSRSDAEWVSATADEIAAILRAGGIGIDLGLLTEALAESWTRKSPFVSRRVPRALIGVGTALAIWLWIRGMARPRQRRKREPQPSKEHR